MRILKLRSVRKEQHIYATFFMGQQGQAMANLGTLMMDNSEWDLFKTALLYGAIHTCGYLKVIRENNEKPTAPKPVEPENVTN